MPDNADYDISPIRIDPQALASDSDRLLALAGQVGDSIKRISDTAADLKLGWVSKSADEAQAFNDRWNSVMKQMFGEKDGDTGVLPAMAGGILGTGIAYSHLEKELESAFLKFSSGLADTSSDGGQPSDHTGPDFPITQDYPN
ncbi:WXG100 family type VII secretion target [Streptomyces sp. NPDC001493]